MKIVVAVDTFKGSLSSLEAGSAISEGIHRVMDDADIVITGEGRLDGQTVMGKAPIGVANIAKISKTGYRIFRLCGRRCHYLQSARN